MVGYIRVSTDKQADEGQGWRFRKADPILGARPPGIGLCPGAATRGR
jgi:hypothetical protein